MFKADFPELKEKQIKDLLDSKIWLFHKSLLEKALQLEDAFKATGIKFDSKVNKLFSDAVTLEA